MTKNNGNGSKNVVGNPQGSPSLGSKHSMELMPEEPPMRAVAMMGAPSIHESFGVQRPGPSFGSSPSLGIPRPSSGVSLKGSQRYSKGEERFESRGKSVEATKEWSGEVSIPREWKIECLQKVPLDFELERTSKEIHGADGSKVASRISNALQKLSIAAEYCARSAKAKCRTSDYVSFRIRLFSGGDDGQPVVVEMQRRNGSCCSFMKTCRAILAAADGHPCPIACAEKKSMPVFQKPIGEMKCLKGMTNETTTEDMKVAVDCAVNLLEENKRDSTILALENLCILTDPLKTVPETAVRMSKVVVLGDEPRTIRADVAELLKGDARSLDSLEGIEDHVDEAFCIRHLALSVFANSLCLTAKEGVLEKAVEDEDWFVDFLIPTLLREVEFAEECPNIACAASCCVKSLVCSSSIARDCVLELEGEEALGRAQSLGKRRHENLAVETTRCVSVLQKPV